MRVCSCARPFFAPLVLGCRAGASCFSANGLRLLAACCVELLLPLLPVVGMFLRTSSGAGYQGPYRMAYTCFCSRVVTCSKGLNNSTLPTHLL